MDSPSDYQSHFPNFRPGKACRVYVCEQAAQPEAGSDQGFPKWIFTTYYPGGNRVPVDRARQFINRPVAGSKLYDAYVHWARESQTPVVDDIGFVTSRGDAGEYCRYVL